jgi:hypothetical protein
MLEQVGVAVTIGSTAMFHWRGLGVGMTQAACFFMHPAVFRSERGYCGMYGL